jgi:N-acetylglucosamine kinase-like BadF-type ATPase
VAGVTGFGVEQVPLLRDMLASALGLGADAVRAMSDIELVCHAAFAPGQGYVVYAGTGSVAAFLDEHGTLQRAGGRGVIIDDAGGGHWIAREALRHIWRADDAAPGVWRAWPLAVHLAQHMGGTGWAPTRQWVYGATRGELGMLALAVASAAREGDAAALDVLRRAGTELARLAQAMLLRHGARAVVLAGRVWELHPAIEESLRAALPAHVQVRRLSMPPHHAAARLAATGAPA